MPYLMMTLGYLKTKYTGTMFILTVLGGLAMVVFDQAEMKRMGRHGEARLARCLGLIYVVAGLGLWFIRLLVASLGLGDR